MAKDKPAKYWQFKLDTRRKFTELSQEIARINSGSGADIDLTAYLLKADLTKSRIQSTLGISDWALAATKPSYAWSEITSRPTALSQFTDDVVAGKYLRATIYGNFDADTLFNDGFHSGYMSHLPSGSPYGIVHTLSYQGGSNSTKPVYASQIFIPSGDDSTSPNDMFFRTSLADSWNTWTKVITDKNIGNYNAGSADILATSFRENINYTSGESSLKLVRYVSDWESNGFPANYSAGLSVMTNYTGWQLLSYGGNIENPYFRSVKDDGAWKAWRQIAFLTDNVASATKLQTPRSLWGQSFDGTDKVSGDINNAAGGIYIHNTNEINSFNGKLYLNHRGRGLTGYGSTNDIVMVGNGGKVGIGNTSPTERLDVSGNVKASGNINATSITINGVTITASNGTITVNGNVFATGAITAKV